MTNRFVLSYSRCCREKRVDPSTVVVTKATEAHTNERSFKLSGLSLPREQIAAIANALCHDVYFKSLELDDLQLGDEGAIMFSRALSINAVVTAVNLSSNNIRNSGLASVGTMLKANTSLRELSLAWNSLGVLEDGCSHIAEGLICNNVLQHLNMSNCQIGHKSACVLASSLVTNTSLTSLDLRWNNLGSIGGKSLLRAMEHNTTLRSIKLAGNHIPEGMLVAIEAKAAQNEVLYKAATADAARARFMAEELSQTQLKATADIDALQQENEGLAASRAELQQFTSLLQDRAKVHASSREQLEARLELHQRELETKTRETTELTSTVLTLREELAKLRQSFTEELSRERQERETATRVHRELESSARAESLKWQQDDAAHQLKARLLQSEIDNQKKEMVRHNSWAEETITATQTRMSEQRQRYEERMLAEKEKADIELRGSQERTRTAYAQLEVTRTDSKHQLAEMQQSMAQSISAVTARLSDQSKEAAQSFELRLVSVKDELKEVRANLVAVKDERERDKLVHRETLKESATALAALEQVKISNAAAAATANAKLEAAHAELKKAGQQAVGQEALVDKLRSQIDAENATHREALRQNAEILAGKERELAQMAESLKAESSKIQAIKAGEIRRFGAIEQAMKSLKTSSEMIAA